MSAEIEVRNVINITGRGAVLIGYVRQGAPRIGQRTALLQVNAEAGRQLEVVAVEKLSSMEAGGQAIGLVFRRPPALEDLQRALPAGTRLMLEDASPL